MVFDGGGWVWYGHGLGLCGGLGFLLLDVVHFWGMG